MESVDGKLNIGAEVRLSASKPREPSQVPFLRDTVKSVGVEWAFAGHSERRVISGESDENINVQVLKLLETGMSCMLCVAESDAEYEKSLAGAVCAIQLKKGLAGVSKEDMPRIAIAYEPAWAIRTGNVATPEIAQDVHKTCRSVSPESVDGLKAQADIDGALVGGALLDAKKFGRIINVEEV
ncbi:MAG: hypothetical protein SGBAC_009378 [Bacillariaceae sp.]